MRHLRALGLARASVVLALAISAGAFTYISYEGYGGVVLLGIFFEVMLIVFIQQGLTRVERAAFAIAAVSLGLLAFIAGRVIDRVAA